MRLISQWPAAIARIKGNESNSGLRGVVRFYQFTGGVMVEADITGLPNNGAGFHGFHIHSGAACKEDDFSTTGGHLDLAGRPHPLHTGDLPPLLSRNGRAYLAVLTDRFSISDIAGRTVVIHHGADDFHSQPAGNAGEKIACGVIQRCQNKMQ